MRNTSFSPLCAAFLLLMLLSPLAAGAAQPQKPVSSPLTITVQEAAVMLNNVLGATDVPTAAFDSVVPAWVFS